MIGYIDALGFMAGFLTTVSALPQVIKSARIKKTDELSRLYLGTLFLGVVIWVIYGFLVGSLPVIVANVVSVVLVGILISLKIKYK